MATTVSAPSGPRHSEPGTADQRSPARQRWVRRAPLLPALVFTIVVTQVPFLLTLVISSLIISILLMGKIH